MIWRVERVAPERSGGAKSRGIDSRFNVGKAKAVKPLAGVKDHPAFFRELCQRNLIENRNMAISWPYVPPACPRSRNIVRLQRGAEQDDAGPIEVRHHVGERSQRKGAMLDNFDAGDDVEFPRRSLWARKRIIALNIRDTVLTQTLGEYAATRPVIQYCQLWLSEKIRRQSVRCLRRTLLNIIRVYFYVVGIVDK